MIPGRGKSKGNRFENLTGRLLSKWITGGDDSTQLIPTRLSGGWEDAAWRQAGDLAPNGTQGDIFRRLFMVECKHQSKDLLWRLYTSEDDQSIQGWWAQLEEEAKKVGCFPMLVFRQTGRPIMVALPSELAWYVSAATEGVVLFDGNCGIMLLDTLFELPIKDFYPLLDQTPDGLTLVSFFHGLPQITTTPGGP